LKLLSFKNWQDTPCIFTDVEMKDEKYFAALNVFQLLKSTENEKSTSQLGIKKKRKQFNNGIKYC